jgi:hypothetical protein
MICIDIKLPKLDSLDLLGAFAATETLSSGMR